jgi:hypothetical protein
MIPGNKYILILILLLYHNHTFAEDKITSSPLINLNKIKPSFDELNNNLDFSENEKYIKEKKKFKNITKSPHVVLIGLDKITAKSSQLIVNLNEAKQFGPLEIKILKCGKIQVDNKIDDVAYMQVKDLTKNDNEKVFIFNGWTFASEPSLTPFDHAIYDLQLVNCYNA